MELLENGLNSSSFGVVAAFVAKMQIDKLGA